ncbi:hypothetical protein CBS147353_10658 [Aspergillus niger]|nr:hypothetical protein CBS147353_10658 [Aspergillus niger]
MVQSGGSVLTQLQQSEVPIIKRIKVTAVVRQESQAALLRERGVDAIVFSGLEDIVLLQHLASEHDMVINTASTFHPVSAKAMILGLAARKKQTKQAVYFIHTSGTGSVADLPLPSSFFDNRKHSDKVIFIHILVIDTGVQEDVKTYTLMSPTIYGVGTGLFNKLSIQVPFFMRAAVEAKHAHVIGEGASIWSSIHINDLTELYELLISKVLGGEVIASGKQGIYFTETGEHTWMEVSNAVAKAGHKLGILQTEDVESLTLEQAADKWVGGNMMFTELGFASNSRTQADLAKEIGWTPKVGLSKLEDACMEEYKAVIGETKKDDKLLAKAAVARKESEGKSS